MPDLPPVLVAQLRPAAEVNHVEWAETGVVDDGQAERRVEHTALVEDMRGALERVPGVGA